MSDYNPPSGNLPIFNSINFEVVPANTIDLTGKLDFPIAQGAEALYNGSTATTQANDDNSTKIATTAYVYNEIFFLLTQPKTLYFSTIQSNIPINGFYKTMDIVLVGSGGGINFPGYSNSDGGALILGGAGGGGGSIQYLGVPINISVNNQINITAGFGFSTLANLGFNGTPNGSYTFGEAVVGVNGETPTSYSAGTPGGAGGNFVFGSIASYASRTGSNGTTGGSGTSSSGAITYPSVGVPTTPGGNYQSYGQGARNVAVQGFNEAGYYNIFASGATSGYVKITFYP